MDERGVEATKAYLEGFDAASRPHSGECPYPDGTPEAAAWWDGFGDWLDAHDANEMA